MGDEFSRIARYLAPLAGPEGLGLTDDAALFTPPAGAQLVFTADQMLEGIHFIPGDPPALIARKLLRRNLSDLASMGASPLGYLLTTALPPGIDESWLAAFAEGLAQDQTEFGIKLFGGDSSSSRTDISLSATLIGHVAPGEALRRNGAKTGDDIWVTGTIGDAALGLRARQGTLPDPSGYLTNRSLLPSPRIGLKLAGIVHAAIDISDGLIQDLGHICRASNLTAHIQADLVPASQDAAMLGAKYLEARLTEGDDYELILVAPPGNADRLAAVCGSLPITRIGTMSEGEGPVVTRDRSGTLVNLKHFGWRHF
jgi:thiamine-monophosphate kinase